MTSLNQIAIRLYRRLYGRSPTAAYSAEGELVLDGRTAVSMAEATAGSVVETGRAHPGGRAALAAAMGRAMAGQRTAAFLSGPELAAAQDLLRNTAGRHLPLVIQLTNRALPTQGEPDGSGHEALHLAAEAGCAVFIAANVQEAVDLSVIAHRVAEQALLPVVVAMDLEATALSAQDVSLPPKSMLDEFLGDPASPMACPTPAQEMLFGETRRRVPRWHDLDLPQLSGSRQDRHAYALGAMASGPFFDSHLAGFVDQAFAEFTRLTGRPQGRLSAHRMEGASEVLLIQGAAAETARAVADRLGGKRGNKLGVLTVRCLRPSPAAELVEHLAGRKAVAVMERQDTPLAGDPPLLRELRTALDRAMENHRYGSDTHPGHPALEGNRRPRLHSVIYGSGGLPLRGADLLALAEKLSGGAPARLFLGVDFHAHTPDHPKRQVMLDRLRRAYPQVEEWGLRAREGVDLRADQAIGIAVLRRDHSIAHTLAGDAGALLQRLAGGRTRAHPGTEPEGWKRDRLLHTPAGSTCPGEDFTLDATLVIGDRALAEAPVCADLRQGGVVLIGGPADGDGLWQSLGATNCAAIRRLDARLYHLTLEGPADDTAPPHDPMAVERANARLLGGLYAALIDNGVLELNRRKVTSAWEENLAELEQADRDALLAAFEAGFDAAAPLAYQDLDDPEALHANVETPMAVRHLGGSDERYDSLPRFWDQVGVLYRDGEAGRLTADPYMATGTVPPLSATFRDLSPTRSMLPRFDPEACTGCGECWSACPDSAIGAVALTPAALLDAGIQATRGDALRPLASKLAGRISAMGRASQFSGAAAGELLRRAWDHLQEKSPLSEERLASVQPALEALIQWAGELPLAVTEALFQSGEKAKKDGGELLSLVIDPDACKACGLCIGVCSENAMLAGPQDNERLDRARILWRTWEATPDTASQTIERVARDGSIGPMAALLLSRHCALAVAGGDAAEAGSGEKIALRLALAGTEYQQQPLLHRFTTELGEVREKIQELIRDTLAGAIPTDDLDALAARLRSSGGEQVDLARLSGADGIETSRLQRLVDLARALDDEHWRLSQGRYGLGRARFGLAVTDGSVAGWAAAFPNNPFHAPVALDMTGDPQFAAGLLAGQLTAAIRPIELLQQARAELGVRGVEIPRAPLQWEDLDEEQKRLCPPMILVGNEAELGGRGLAQVTWLLNSGLPVKILVLSELDMGLDTRHARARPRDGVNDPRSDLGLMALAQRRAYVAQTSIAEGGHFREVMREALRYCGPALIRVHAPSPQRHGFAPERVLEQARLARNSRAFPLFRYHPEGEGVFGSRIDLDGNPDPHSDWASDGDGQPITPLHWAASEARFAGHFTVLEEDAPNPTGALAWLALDARGRERKTPFIAFDRGGETVRYRVSTELLEQVGRLAHAWRTLQELAGLVTPFTERVQREAEERVAAEHQAELDATRRDYEQQLAEQRARMQMEISGQIKDRLMALAGYE